MTQILRLFRQFRDLDDALHGEIRAHEETKDGLSRAIVTGESERARRIAAETVAAERHEEIDRLLTQVRELREDLTASFRDRIKSVDAVNLKLMEGRTAELPPDMTQFQKDPQKSQPKNIVAVMREIHHNADMALLAKFAPAALKRPTLNEAAAESVD